MLKALRIGRELLVLLATIFNILRLGSVASESAWTLGGGVTHRTRLGSLVAGELCKGHQIINGCVSGVAKTFLFSVEIA